MMPTHSYVHRVGRALGPLLLAVGLAAPLGGRVLAAPPSAAAWSYQGATGPAQWADLSPDFAACRTGQQQSPIDIRTVQPIPYEPLQPRYRSQPLDAVNDGRGVNVLIQPGSELHVGGLSYDLTALHFHAPGETLINGVAAAAEIHLVHRDRDGRHAVVVVPIQPGPHPNSALVRIAERLPLRAGERVNYRQLGINALLLFPPDRGYYRYTGSFANPPCSEPVTWFILAAPVELAPELIGRIARATGGNARPAQPLNGRPVFVSLPR